MHSQGREVTQNHTEEMLRGGHISIQRLLSRAALPSFAPPALETPHPSPKQVRKGTVLQAWLRTSGLAEPWACLCQTQALGAKEGREQFNIFLSFYLPFQNSTFLTRFSHPHTVLGERSVTG